jgi:hypothetical protein
LRVPDGGVFAALRARSARSLRTAADAAARSVSNTGAMTSVASRFMSGEAKYDW